MNRLLFLLASVASAAQLDVVGLEKDLAALTKDFKGRVGVCVQSDRATACVRPDDKFAMQSVVKLMVGFAVMDAVDTQGWKLDTQVHVQRKDLSLYVQPIEKLVGPKGYTTTIGDLVRGAVIDSDSAATDILIARLGGTAAVQAVLKRRGVNGIRVDRDERHLQTEIVESHGVGVRRAACAGQGDCRCAGCDSLAGVCCLSSGCARYLDSTGDGGVSESVVEREAAFRLVDKVSDAGDEGMQNVSDPT